MKAELHVQSSPAVASTVLKLTLVVSVLLTVSYGIVKMFANAISLLI